MADEEVKLHGMWASPFTFRIKLALKLKGVQYEYIEEDLSNKSPALLKHNPVYKKTPVLVHNEKPVSESLIILEYIDETWRNNPLLPTDPYSRAMAHFWAKFVDEQILEKGSKRRDEEEQKRAMEETSQNLKLLENEIQGKEFFGGESIGYLDIVILALMYWLTLWEEVTGGVYMVTNQTPDLCQWIKKLLDIEAIKECIPPRDKHATVLKSIYEAANSVSS